MTAWIRMIAPAEAEGYLRQLYDRVKGPGGVNRGLLRDFIFMLKDLGLSSATIRRHRPDGQQHDRIRPTAVPVHGHGA